MKPFILDEMKEHEWEKDVRYSNTGFFWKLDDNCTWNVTEKVDRRGRIAFVAECQSEGT